MSRRVICSQCSNEDGAFCVVKKEGVKINKRRNCEIFELDESKVKEKREIPTIKVGPYYWMSRSELKKLVKKQEREDQMRQEIYRTNKAFDLKEFTSTATDSGNQEYGTSTIDSLPEKTESDLL